MRCPYCNENNSKVIDSRAKSDGKVIRRRRECISCKKRFTTKEYIEESPILVVKCDERREVFNREKLKQGILLACTKRPISINQIEALVSQVENSIRDQSKEEIASKEIGEILDLSPSTVRSRLREARMILAKGLLERGVEP